MQQTTLEFPDGKVRFQAIGDGVVRAERAGPEGEFCDEPTFTVIERPQGGASLGRADARRDTDRAILSVSREEPHAQALICADRSADSVQEFIASLELRIAGRSVWSTAEDTALASLPPEPDQLPRPSEAADVWALHDIPRVVPPQWGALPPPEASRDDPTSGWRIEEDAFDVYLFLYSADRAALRRDFIALTGRIPVPPLWTFGLWTSRYYPYTEESALDVIDRYRELDIPLDVFVLDTDWRVGASRGYEVDTELFPDMERFLTRCRERGVRTMFNDHPEPKGMGALDPELFEYRHANLTRYLNMGLTAWWFDRNWPEIIPGPVPGIESAVWGQKLFYDIITDHQPSKRPLLLSMPGSHPASHRYPICFAGDTESDWHALAESVRDTLSEGFQLRPYTVADIGGHSGFPSPEQYIRWIQWASVCPTFRLHCGPKNRYRYPWRFGDAALELTRAYVTMRYRLLPYLYSLAHRAGRTGVPLAASVEEIDPRCPEKARDSVFCLGDGLLFAPVTRSINGAAEHADLPYRFATPLRRRVWTERQLEGGGFDTAHLPETPPAETGHDAEIRINSFNSSEKNMAWGNSYFVVWDGRFRAEEAGWYRFRLEGNGRKELRLDDAEHPQLRAQFDVGTKEAILELEPGEHSIAVSFLHSGGGMPCIELAVGKVPEPETTSRPAEPTVPVWLPAGHWRDLWTGAVHNGQGVVYAAAGIGSLPGYARCGSILPLTRAADRTHTAFWESLSLEVFPHVGDGTSETTVVFDDGESTAYLAGGASQLTVSLERRGNVVRLTARPEDVTHEVGLTVRLHLLPREGVRQAVVNGTEVSYRELPAPETRPTPIPLAEDSAWFENGITVSISDLPLGGSIELHMTLE
jgi:hypothetical protein